MPVVKAFSRIFCTASLAAGLTASWLAARENPESSSADTVGEVLEYPPPPSAAAPTSAAPGSPEVRARERRVSALRKSGNTLYTLGNVSMIAGIAGGIVAANRDMPALGQASSWAYLAGLPVLGIGAGQVYEAYRLQNPAVGRDGRAPWVLYGVGWGAQVIGYSLFVVGFMENFTDSWSARDESEDGVGLMIAGGVMALGGVAMHMVSWYQFSARRAEADHALSLTLEPMIPLDARGGVAGAGLRLKARF